MIFDDGLIRVWGKGTDDGDSDRATLGGTADGSGTQGSSKPIRCLSRFL